MKDHRQAALDAATRRCSISRGLLQKIEIPWRGCYHVSTVASRWVQVISVFVAATFSTYVARAGDVDLREAHILIAEKSRSQTEPVAARMLQEEVQKRTGLKWPVSSEQVGRQPAIALVTAGAGKLAGRKVPSAPGLKREGYRICVEPGAGPVVWVIGADVRGVLFGAGRLLRLLNWGSGRCRTGGEHRYHHRTCVSYSRSSVGVPCPGQLLRCLECGGLRAVHPRSGPLRDQLH